MQKPKPNSSPLTPKTIAIISLASVAFVAIATCAGYLATLPVSSESYADTPRALTTDELAKRCTEKFYGEAGRQCMHDVYNENSALPEEYKAKKVYGLE